MRRLSNRLTPVGFGLALVLVLALALQAKRTQDELLYANASVTRSLELITTLQGTLSALQDVETGMRGYVLTGAPRFLEPYERGLADLRGQRTRLDDLLGPWPGGRAWLARLDRAVARRLDLARVNVELRRGAGLETAARQVREGGGKEAMDRVRALLGEQQARERARLAREHAAVERQLERSRRDTLLGGGAALVLLLSALAATDRSLRRERLLAERARAGEARQTALLQAMPDALWQLDEDGVARALASGADAMPRLPPGLEPVLRGRLASTVPGAGVQAFDWTDGAGRDFEVRVVAAAGSDRLAIVRDVTDAARSRRQLQDRRAFLRSIVDTDESLVFVRDAAGRFVLCNVAFCDVLALDPSQMEGEAPGALADAGLLAPLLEGDAALLAGEGEWRREQVRIVDAHGTERWLQVLKRPLELSEGGRQVLTVAIDITARLRMERMKNEFVSTVSHELRTPLTSIRGALGMLAGGVAGDLPAAAAPLVDIAHKNTERLVRLINDILDIEKLESGRLQLQPQALSLRPLVAQAVEQIATYAAPFDVRVVLAPGADGEVEVDPDRFAQVMANLLSNAIKHSPPGGTVEVGMRARHGGWQVCVADRGEGIPEAFRPRVFERFAQADGSDVRTRGGTGLGLAITRALVEQMAGTIGFDTVLGEGTTFEVWFPSARRAPARPAPSTAPAESIVLLEDDAGTAEELAGMLAVHGYATRVAATPAEARALLAADGGVRGLVIDLGLAGEAGPSFLRELRAHPRHARLPVLLLGLRPGDDGLRGGAVGVVDWLDKPLDPEQVARAVRTCLRGVPRPRVLHVEDDADLRALVARLLATQALALDGAADLAGARALLARHHYDLAILDLMLPDGDGAELLPELSAAQPPTPAIIFSAQDAGTTPELRGVLRRLVKSRNDAAELAALITANLHNWPSGPSPEEAE